MLIAEIIRKKRDKYILTKEEIEFFIHGLCNDQISDAQASAFLMASFLNGLSTEELTYLTSAMKESGDVLHFNDLAHDRIIDKHSTGGVGDLVSLPLVAIIAACDVYIPMISGRGLGHTGGTLDKMSSIPGYNLFPSNDIFKKVVKEVGCAIIGQTGNLAPADKKLYAIRDITGSVESVALITASILSKKLSSGINYLVMDVKYGNGAFFSDLDRCKALANMLVQVGNSLGLPTKAIITDMNEALGSNIGNALEVIEAIRYLTGDYKLNTKLHSVITELASNMLIVSKIVDNKPDALLKINHVLSSGAAAEKFAKMVHVLGGPSNFLEEYQYALPESERKQDLYLQQEGCIEYIDTRELGLLLIHLGGGRRNIDDKLDYSVGLSNVLKVGDQVDASTPFCVVHYNDITDFEYVKSKINTIVKVQTSGSVDCYPYFYEIS